MSHSAPLAHSHTTIAHPAASSNDPASAPSATTASTAPPRVTRAKLRSAESDAEHPHDPSSSPVHQVSTTARRRSSRLSAIGASGQAEASTSTAGKGKRKADNAKPSATISDRKGKKKASEPDPDLDDTATPRTKRSRPSRSSNTSLRAAKGSKSTSTRKTSGKSMPKRTTPREKRGGATGNADRSKKGDTAAKHLIDDGLDEDERHWMDESGGSGMMGESYHEDEDMDESDHDDEEDEDDEDDEDDGAGPSGPSGNAFDRIARLAGESGGMFDEATAAAIFGGGFRAFGGMMSSLASTFKRLRTNLRSPKPAARLAALREASELLLVSNEDTLGSSFSIASFATEFIAILDGKPNMDADASGGAPPALDAMDEDAQLAAILAMTGGDDGDDQEEMEAQLLACRCLAHLLEALPGSGHTLVHLGAVPVLCSKLNEISYIELAEQTLSTMEKISAEYPAAIVREGGLGALLNYLPFFSTNVQRTAVTAAANCCRNISGEHYAMIRNVFPTLREVLTQGDQRLVEQATLAVVRTLESYRHNAEHLEGLLDVPTIVVINALLLPSGGSPLISASTYTHLLKALTSAARGSAKVALAFLQAGVTNTLYQILTGVLPSTHAEDEQGNAEGGQGLSGGVADMVVMQNLAHRPKEQVEEALSLITELLPPLPRDGVFDSKAYTEKNLAKIKKGRGRAERSTRSTRASDAADASGTATPGDVSGSTPLSSLATTQAAIAKAKRDAEQQYEERVQLFRDKPDFVANFVKLIVPVLVDVYAASVTPRVRTKTLNGLVKAASFAEAGDLEATLQSVPMASFLGSIISSKDNASYVLSALQLVELLATKLPAVYQTSFLREGVVFEIEALANEDLSTKKAADEVKTEPEDPSTPRPNLLEDIKPLLPQGEIPTALASILYDPGSTPRKSAVIDPNDANIIRARVIGAKKVFQLGGEMQNEATLVLDELGALIRRLCVPEATEAELRDSLREIAAQFSNVGQALSSFELLKSGLVDGLLDFVDIDGAVSALERRAILYDIFSDTALSSPSPLNMLVKRLHESLGRLESFEVEMAFGGSADRASSSTLGRSVRIRLQAEEGQDVPRQVAALSVTIQAIAPMQAIHDYLRPRVADGNYGSSNLSSMFAAYAAGGGGAARLLSALASANAGLDLGVPLSSSAPARSAPPEPAAAESTRVPRQRRRSARLSGRADDAPASAPEPSTSAPEPSMLPPMPMDMDFDDEDDYADEYDAEVFDNEDMDDIARPQEKVVNMSVAPDGSRVEAKTPDGTRVATPQQGASVAGPSAPAETPTRTSSYAGAVKTAPVDWHLEFTMNGHPLAMDDTVYGAIHRHQQQQASRGLNVFSLPIIFKFQKVDGPSPARAPIDAPSPASTVSVMPDALEPSAPTSKILRLLRVVHNLCVDGRDASGGRGAQFDESLFVNNKLTAKLTRQLEETMILASNCLPDWAIELPKHFSFLFPFETRYSFLQSTSFGYGRLIAKWQASQPRSSSHRRDDNLSHLARLVRQKVRISRAQLLESCAKVLELYGTSSGLLEVEYFDEIGTGLGPTLEFYSLASKEFARRSLQLWRDEDEARAGPYVFHPHGLFPVPIGDETKSVDYFKTLGLFVGRALLDSRIIDVNLNRVFLKLALGQPVRQTIATLKQVDEPLARSLDRLQSYLQARKEIEAMVSLPASSRRNKLASLTVGGAKLHDLSLDFTLPGYDIELKPGGRLIDVDDSNLEEYLERVLDLTLGSGVSRQVKAFQAGFSMIFSISDLQIFSPDELALLFGNSDEDWSVETLERSIKADHGYTSDSRAVRNLIEVMSSYDKDRRRQFLQFITGAPKLPIGGFRGLNPPFTVVRKPHEAPFRADDYLPSVMTCAQYLKMPDYSTKEVLGMQLERAMLDGGGSFHLS
ncbi:Ubiquitin fusion degradation protein 4 [Cryptotrichosporon argae]